jgi:hypothetical protein
MIYSIYNVAECAVIADDSSPPKLRWLKFILFSRNNLLQYYFVSFLFSTYSNNIQMNIRFASFSFSFSFHFVRFYSLLFVRTCVTPPVFSKLNVLIFADFTMPNV